MWYNRCEKKRKNRAKLYTKSPSRRVLHTKQVTFYREDLSLLLNIHYVGAIVVERKYFTCPSRESNPGRWIYRQTLYHVAVKAGFYRKAVEVYYIPRPCDMQFESFQVFFILLLKMIGLKPNHPSYVEVNGLTLDVD